jgi:hypothetical protein
VVHTPNEDGVPFSSVQCDSSGAPTIKVRVTTQAATAVAAMIARNQK